MIQDQASRAPRRVVFDCNVYLQAAVRDGGPAFACVALAESGGCIGLVSADTLAELTNILSRPSVRKKFTALTDHHVDAYLAAGRSRRRDLGVYEDVNEARDFAERDAVGLEGMRGTPLSTIRQKRPFVRT